MELSGEELDAIEARARADAQTGLKKVLSDTPVRTAFVDLSAGEQAQLERFAQIEAGAHFTENFGVYGLGRWSDKEGALAEIGAEWRW